MEERRTDRRTRVLLRAAIHLPGGARIACSIRDLSKGGARLHLSQPAQVPDRFEVVIDADGRRFDCAMRHRSGTSLNVQFLSVIDKGLQMQAFGR
jgi:methyl-accepting chemotaxis protein